MTGRKQGENRAKMGKKNGQIKNNKFASFFWFETTQKIVLAVFIRCLAPKIQIFGHFWLKSAFLGPNFSRTEIFTAKPMVVGCVQHYSTHLVKKIKKMFSRFFRKVQKNCKKW